MRVSRVFLCAIVFLALSGPIRAADPVWMEMTSRNFRLFTDTTEVKGRRLLEDLEGRLGAMSVVLGSIPQRQFPVEVFLFSKKEEFLEGAPRPSGPDAPSEFQKAAYLWRGPDRIFVAARDRSPADIADDVGHALGHVFFERTVRWRPFWLAEGAAEVFRKVGRNPDTRKVANGYPVTDILEIVPARQYDDDAPASPFRIQAHRLFRIVANEHGPKLKSFLQELVTEAGGEAKLGVDVSVLQAPLDAYVETLIPPSAGSPEIKTVASTPEAIGTHRGDLLLAAKKTSEAAAWYRGDRPESRMARAILARFSRSGGEPIAVLGRAAMDFPDAGLVLFHLGSLETKAPDALDLQFRSLQRATQLLPKFGRAHAQLARVETLLGKPEDALKEIDRALELEPEFADEYFLIRAEAQLALLNYGEANAAARMAGALPHSDKSTDFDLKSSEMTRRVEEVRRDVEGKRVQQMRAEIGAIVAAREPPRQPPPPPPPDRAGKIEYTMQSSRQIRILTSPLPTYSNSLVQKQSVGKITIRVLIGVDGKVTQASIVDSQLAEMNTATLDAVKKWTFSTVTSPVDARIVFTFSVQ
jgi:TonB family protein